MKGRIAVLVVLSLAPLTLFAQETDASRHGGGFVSVKPYGFVRNYFNYDSRKTYTVIGGEYNFIPYDEQWNEDHSEDLNAVAHAQLQALTTRVGLNVQGPELWGCATAGKVEGDFGGFGSNNYVFRIRQAYVKLSRGGENRYGELLVGQTWHPLGGDIMPEVLGMAAGSPFRPHSRTPQVRGTQEFKIQDSEFKIGYTAALLYQLQYVNNGPSSASDPSSVASTSFAGNALWPEAFLGFNCKTGGFYGQIGVDAQLLRPRTHALSGGVTHKVDETVSSFTPTLYAQYTDAKVSVKFRTLLAQNASHLNQLVGYGVTGVNDDGSWNYAPMRASISYLNMAYGKTYRFNLFLGYMKNLGAGENLYAFTDGAGNTFYRIYAKGGENFTHLNSLYRIAPSVSYNVKAFNVGIEYEWTAVTYGDHNTDGSVADNANLHQVANHRICALVKYNF